MIIVTANLGLLSFPSESQVHQARSQRQPSRVTAAVIGRAISGRCQYLKSFRRALFFAFFLIDRWPGQDPA
jgi:hypothetical protein